MGTPAMGIVGREGPPTPATGGTIILGDKIVMIKIQHLKSSYKEI